MSFPWPINDKVTAFVEDVGGLFWHYTIGLAIPPTTTPIYATYVPDPKTKALIIGLTFGDVYEYDPVTRTFGPEVRNVDIGVYHSCAQKMEWHWDPFVKSILFVMPYPQLIWCDASRPYEILIVNRTDKCVWADATFWMIKFPRRVLCPVLGTYCDPEELWKYYMKGIVIDYIRKGVEAERSIAPEKSS